VDRATDEARDLNEFIETGRGSERFQRSGESLTLDPMIQAGQDLKEFIETVAVETKPDGSHLREERFQRIADRLSDIQRTALDKVEEQLEHGPIKADVTGGKDQRPNIDFSYKMLASKGINTCSAKVSPRLLNVENVTVTNSSGCCGTDELMSQQTI